MKSIILLVNLLLLSDIVCAKGGGHGGSHGSGDHGVGSHGFGTHGSNSHESNGGGGVISKCDEKSILSNQLILVLFLEILFALFASCIDHFVYCL